MGNTDNMSRSISTNSISTAAFFSFNTPNIMRKKLNNNRVVVLGRSNQHCFFSSNEKTNNMKIMTNKKKLLASLLKNNLKILKKKITCCAVNRVYRWRAIFPGRFFPGICGVIIILNNNRVYLLGKWNQHIFLLWRWSMGNTLLVRSAAVLILCC